MKIELIEWVSSFLLPTKNIKITRYCMRSYFIILSQWVTGSHPWPTWPIQKWWPIWPMTHDPLTHFHLWPPQGSTYTIWWLIRYSECLENDIIQGAIPRTGKRGWPKTSWLCSNVAVKQVGLFISKICWRNIVHIRYRAKTVRYAQPKMVNRLNL